MTQVGKDTLGTRSTLTVDGKDYAYYSFTKASEKLGDVSRLPFSLKVLLENMLRFEDGGHTVSTDHAQAIVDWMKNPTTGDEIQYRPARVLLQDFTGVPCVVDLAAMRDAIAALGGDTQKINPQVPVNLVIDHSVMVDEFGHPKAFEKNVELEYARNAERYDFLKWGSKSFENFSAVPPGTGICHQVNLEHIGKTVWSSKDQDGNLTAYPDTCVGTDSHTTMINGLGVLGWGVGGIEAEAAMLGQPISMLIPKVVGFKLDNGAGRRRDRNRSRADLRADAARSRRGRQLRRILRPGRRQSQPRRPCDDRQHGARIRCDLRLLRCRRQDARLPAPDGPRRAPDRSRRSLLPRTGHVDRAGQRAGLHRNPQPRHGERRPEPRRTQASAGQGRAARRRRIVQFRSQERSTTRTSRTASMWTIRTTISATATS